MQANTTFVTDLLTFGYIVPKSIDYPKCIFESSGSGNSPSSVPIATPNPQIGSLGLAGEQTSALVVFLPVKFGDFAVSALLDYGATHSFLVASLIPKL